MTVFGSEGIVHHNRYYDYKPLVREVATFFTTGQPPVEPEETLEEFVFMAAAERSKEQDGVPVTLEDVLAEAKQSLAQRRPNSAR